MKRAAPTVLHDGFELLLDAPITASLDRQAPGSILVLDYKLLRPGATYQVAHVTHDKAHGEVRGYIVADGRAYLRTPCYSGTWTEMDAAVAKALHAVVVPYEISAGGRVSFPEASTT